MTWEDLKAWVNSSADQDTIVERCWDEATALVTNYVRERAVPTVIFDRARLEVGAELFNKRSAPNGIAQFATFDGVSTARVARDPMVAAYPLLNPVIGGFTVA